MLFCKNDSKENLGSRKKWLSYRKNFHLPYGVLSLLRIYLLDGTLGHFTRICFSPALHDGRWMPIADVTDWEKES